MHIKLRDREGRKKSWRHITSRTDKKSRIIALVVCFYYFTSISLVISNKVVLKGSSLPYPFFITWIQLVLAFLCFVFLDVLKEYFSFLSIFPPLTIDWRIVGQVLPMTTVFILMVTTNNLCLQYVQLSFYQVARSLSILFSLILSRVLFSERTSWKAACTSLIIMVGFALGSWGEVPSQFSLAGLLFGVLSSFFVALNSILVKSVGEKTFNNDQWMLMYYNTCLAIPLLLLLTLIKGELYEALPMVFSLPLSTYLSLLVTGLLGFLINIAISLQIKYTSPLTNNVSGTFKGVFQIVISVIWFDNEITALNALGSVLVLVGSGMYSHVRYTEMHNKEVAKSQKKAKKGV